MSKQQLLDMINEWNHETHTFLGNVKEALTTLENQQKQQIISYFTYSLNLSSKSNEDHFIIGTYHIHNLSHTFMTNPYICIKLSEDSPFHFSGKYVYKPRKLATIPQDAWEKLNDHTNRMEYWLKPLSVKLIKPNDVLSFSNFQMKWKSTESYSGSVTGFTYCEEYKEGIAAVNQLFISGS
ncbi:hypothetical protein [Halalkalibacter sp. APA_J-10(15)]|uniref:hypothetical protein n=1 Tax=unclassified Halalkalibacter TaxID=2893063 RepID=UPI001FF2334E|nr:hypothetical protein [Halalkalibacter sp. APA_J-10(15)]MCK0471927.1 hypothetical protein [Halalkalibacter sp. APA_J-10(15)]